MQSRTNDILADYATDKHKTVQQLTHTDTIRALNKDFKAEIKEILAMATKSNSLTRKGSSLKPNQVLSVPTVEVDGEGDPIVETTDAAGNPLTYKMINVNLGKGDINDVFAQVKESINNLAKIHSEDLIALKNAHSRSTGSFAGDKARIPSEDLMNFFDEASSPLTEEGAPNANAVPELVALRNAGALDLLLNIQGGVSQEGPGITSNNVVSSLINIYNFSKDLQQFARINVGKARAQQDRQWVGVDPLFDQFFGALIDANGTKKTQELAIAGKQLGAIKTDKLVERQFLVEELNTTTDVKTREDLTKKISNIDTKLINKYTAPSRDLFLQISLGTFARAGAFDPSKKNETTGNTYAVDMRANLGNYVGNPASLKAYEEIVRAQKTATFNSVMNSYAESMVAYEVQKGAAILAGAPEPSRPKKPVKGTIQYNLGFPAIATSVDGTDQALANRAALDSSSQAIRNSRINIGIASKSA